MSLDDIFDANLIQILPALHVRMVSNQLSGFLLATFLFDGHVIYSVGTIF